MAIIYDAKHHIMIDEATGVTLKGFSRPDYQTIYRYCDPSVTATAKSNRGGLPPGTAELVSELVYARAPVPTPEGRLHWGPLAGCRVSCLGLYNLYRAHFQAAGNTPEVLAAVAKASDFARDAIAAEWQERGDAAPLVDMDGTLSSEIRCYVVKYGLSSA